jgi:hypothetical protein
MHTFIVFVDYLCYKKRGYGYTIKTKRMEICAPDILSASTQARKNGGEVSMIWPKLG